MEDADLTERGFFFFGAVVCLAAFGKKCHV